MKDREAYMSINRRNTSSEPRESASASPLTSEVQNLDIVSLNKSLGLVTLTIMFEHVKHVLLG